MPYSLFQFFCEKLVVLYHLTADNTSSKYEKQRIFQSAVELTVSLEFTISSQQNYLALDVIEHGIIICDRRNMIAIFYSIVKRLLIIIHELFGHVLLLLLRTCKSRCSEVCYPTTTGSAGSPARLTANSV